MLLSKVRKLAGAPVSWVDELDLPPVRLGEETIGFAGPVRAELTARSRGTAVTVSGRVEAVAEVRCHRCLEPVRLPITAPYEEEFRPLVEGEPPGPGIEEADNVHLVAGDAVDLGETILAAVLLELPMRVVCRPDCRGLCPRCGQNLNEGTCDCPAEGGDPRLAVLQEFFRAENRKPRKEG